MFFINWRPIISITIPINTTLGKFNPVLPSVEAFRRDAVLTVTEAALSASVMVDFSDSAVTSRPLTMRSPLMVTLRSVTGSCTMISGLSNTSVSCSAVTNACLSAMRRAAATPVASTHLTMPTILRV